MDVVATWGGLNLGRALGLGVGLLVGSYVGVLVVFVRWARSFS